MSSFRFSVPRFFRNSCALGILILTAHSGWSYQEPFFSVYTSEIQEPGNLEVTCRSATTKPDGMNRLLELSTEFEYSLTSRWAVELYIGGEPTGIGQSHFSGFELENHFRLLNSDHWINPMVSIEFEKDNGVDDALWEVTGHDGKQNLTVSDGKARAESAELETTLVLSSSVKGWTIAENLIVEKEVHHAPYEFGYAVGVSRALALFARSDRCPSCGKNVQLGVEMYGGLGTHNDVGLRDTSQYVAPIVAWTIAKGPTLRVSPGFGLTGTSAGFQLRFGLSYEIDGFGRTIGSLFHRSR